MQAQKDDKEYQPPPTEQYCKETSANAISVEDVEKLIAKHLSTRGGRTKGNRNGTKETKTSPKAQALDEDGTPVTYCWTHGVTRNLKHTSCTCIRKADGHKTEATYSNRMGGSNERQKARNN